METIIGVPKLDKYFLKGNGLISEQLAIIFKKTSVYEPSYLMRRKLQQNRKLDLITDLQRCDVFSILNVLDVVEGTFIQFLPRQIIAYKVKDNAMPHKSFTYEFSKIFNTKTTQSRAI